MAAFWILIAQKFWPPRVCLSRPQTATSGFLCLRPWWTAAVSEVQMAQTGTGDWSVLLIWSWADTRSTGPSFFPTCSVINVSTVTGKNWVDVLGRKRPMRWDSSWWEEWRRIAALSIICRCIFFAAAEVQIHYLPFVTVNDLGPFRQEASPQVRDSGVFMGPSESFRRSVSKLSVQNNIATKRWRAANSYVMRKTFLSPENLAVILI